MNVGDGFLKPDIDNIGTFYSPNEYRHRSQLNIDYMDLCGFMFIAIHYAESAYSIHR